MSLRQSTYIGFALLFLLVPADGIFGDSGGWRTRETRHVRIVYRYEDRGSAAELATFADEVFESVTEFYDYRPDERVLCVLRSDTDFANGSFNPLPPHINLMTEAPMGPWMGAATESWLKVVFAHELAHYIHLTDRAGLFGTLSRVFGPSVATAQAGFLPGWMIEGGPVLVETALTSGGRGRNQFFEMYARALLLEEELFTLSEAGHATRFPPPGRIYLAGYLIHHHLIETYGEAAFREVIERFLRFPLFGPNLAIRRVTGESMRAIFDSMVADLTSRYTSSPETQGTTLTPDRIGDYYLPRIINGAWYAYRTVLDEPRGIVRFDPETGGEELLLKVSLSDGYSFDIHDSEELVVAAVPVARRTIGRNTVTSELIVADLGSGARRYIAGSEHLRHPVFTADEGRVVAVRQEAGYASLVIVDLATGNQSLLLRIPGANLFTPDITDTSEVVFVANREGRQEIGSISLSAPPAVRATPTGGHNESLITWLTSTPDTAEYYPRAEAGSVVYGADGRDTLELRELDRGSTESRVIATDRVGAFAGFRYLDTVVYATYTANGYALKRIPAGLVPDSGTEHLEQPSARADTGQPVPIQGSTTPPEGMTGVDPGVAYTDLPRLACWFPLPVVSDPFTGSITGFGAGLAALFVSPVTGNQMVIQAAIGPETLQPSWSLHLSLFNDRFPFALSLLQGYREDSEEASQTTELSVSQSFPIVGFASYPVSRSASVGLGTTYRLEYQEDSPFEFMRASTPPVHTLIATLQAGARVIRRGSSLAPTPPVDFSIGARADIAIIKPATDYPLLQAVIRSSGSIPLGGNHVARIDATTGVRSPGVSAASSRPKGGFVPTVDPGRLDTLLGASYLTPLIPLDVAIPGGFHLGGLRFELFAEGYGSVPSPGVPISIDPYLYTGIEIEIEIGRTADIPLGFGISTRISTTDPGTFDPGRDIRFFGEIGNVIGAISGIRSPEFER